MNVQVYLIYKFNLVSYKIPTLQKLKNIRVINSYLIGYDKTLQIYNTSLYKSLY